MFRPRRSFSLVALACMLLAPVTAVAQTELWVEQFGTAERDGVLALTADSAGGLFAAGYTEGSLGGPTAGLDDIWVARYDADGALAWMKQVGTPRPDRATAMSPDIDGGFFVGGYSQGSLGGPNAGGLDIWLARYNKDGSRAWITQFGSSLNDWVHSISPDGAGGVFLAGTTDDSLGGPSAGGMDSWIARYGPTGNRVWIAQIGTARGDQATAVAEDGAGGAFVAGYALDDLGGPSAGIDDVWLARYDAVGRQVWIKQFGTRSVDRAFALAPDGAGGFFASGLTGGSLAGPSSGGLDAWVGRFDENGAPLWMDQFGLLAWEQRTDAVALVPDGGSGVFVAGITPGPLFGPYSGVWYDAWMAHYNEGGSRVWTVQFGTDESDRVAALASDGAGGAFIAGHTYGSIGGHHFGDTDAWIARFGDDSCYADCDRSGSLDFFDFLCFQNAFAASDPLADCDGSGELDFFDFLCFQNASAAGCP